MHHIISLQGQGNTITVDDLIEISKSEYSLNLSGNSGADDVLLTINGVKNGEGRGLFGNKIIFPVDKYGPEIENSKCYAVPYLNSEHYYWVYVYFKEEINQSDAEKKSNYSFSVKEPTGVFRFLTIALYNGTKSVMLLTNITAPNGTDGISDVTLQITVSNIRDKCGNPITNNGVTNKVNVWLENP